MPLIIGIAGKIGVGKTTTSDYLEQKYSFSEYSFAEPIKKIGLAFGFESHQLYGTQRQKMEVNEHWGVSARHFLQKFGTDICRDVMPTIIPDMKFGDSGTPWIRLFEIHVAKLVKENPHACIVISDVRFVNEAEAIQKMGGYVFRIDREEKIETDEKTASHASETELMKINADLILDNSGTKDTLYATLDSVIGNIVRGM
jgi:hypothetical protein